MKKQQGFTLIELMIVVAIIGVLSAIAIPAYKNYVTKSEASSALATLKALVTPAELYIQETGPISDATTLDKIGTQTDANSLGEITLGANAIIFTFDDSAINGATLTLTRSDTSGWACAAVKPTVGKFPPIDGCVIPQ